MITKTTSIPPHPDFVVIFSCDVCGQRLNMERIPTANAGAAFSSTVVECPNCKKEQRVYADIDGNELVIDFSDMEELVLVV